MGVLRKGEKANTRDALDHYQAGHSVLVYELVINPVTWAGGVQSKYSDIIEQVEASGWLLESTAFNGRGDRWMLVFRRNTTLPRHLHERL